MNNDATNPQSSASGGYVSFVAHIWVGERGKLIRGTIEDAHTGTRLALDLSEIVEFLQASLAHAPGQTWNLQIEEDEDMKEEPPSEEPEERLADTDGQDDRAQDQREGEES